MSNLFLISKTVDISKQINTIFSISKKTFATAIEHDIDPDNSKPCIDPPI